MFYFFFRCAGKHFRIASDNTADTKSTLQKGGTSGKKSMLSTSRCVTISVQSDLHIHLSLLHQLLLNPDYNRGKTDWVLQNRISVATHDLHRGDIVTFITPYDPKQLAVKRIIGLEGDLVRTKKDKHTGIRVPRGHVWVEGDNSKYSHDSNNYGPISASLVTSKATHVIWPPSRWQKLDSMEIDSDRVIKAD